VRLKEFAGMDVTAKDFRTWHATVLAAVGLAVSTPAGHGSPIARKLAVAWVVKEVSHYLGNTPAVCRASYINSRLIELYEEGRTIAHELGRLGEGAALGHPATQGPVEEAVRRLLDGDYRPGCSRRGRRCRCTAAVPPPRIALSS